MAKSEKDNVSKAHTGGVKASDLPASVGGTKGDEHPGPATPAQAAPATPGTIPPAPVTTDAAASTPPGLGSFPTTGSPAPLNANPGPAAPVPGKDTTPTHPRSLREADRAADRNDEFSDDFPAPRGSHRKLSADGEADISVRDFVGKVEDFANAFRSGAWGASVRIGGEVLTVFADLMHGGAFSLFGTTVDDAKAMLDVPDVSRALAECKDGSGRVFGSGRAVQWDGGDPHPLSGSPAPLASAADDVKTFDPSTLLVILEAVSKVWEWFASRKKK